jgi:hypothetical protein
MSKTAEFYKHSNITIYYVLIVVVFVLGAVVFG